MSYLVLARKWRPTSFEEVVGQSHITQTLTNALTQQRVAHALLFTGSRGIGKTSCARILARALNCDEGPTAHPCGVCGPCVDIADGKSVDVFEIDGASNNSVEQIREIREAVKFVSTRGKRKIYIIDEVHMLSTAAFNALLKTLEEPPPHVLFVFATTEPHKIPETIVSRCQRFDFKRIPEVAIVDALAKIAMAENIEVDTAALQHIAREAKGGMRDSLSLLDQVIAFCGTRITEKDVRQILGIADRAVLHGLTDAILGGDGQSALQIIDDLFRYGLDLQKFATEFVQHLRDLMVIKVCGHPERLVDIPAGELAALSAQIDPVPPARIHRLFNAFVQGAEEINRSNFPKLVFEMTVLRLCEQGPTLPLAQVLDGLARLEARLDAPLPPEPDDRPRGPAPGPPAEPGPSAGPPPTRPSAPRSLHTTTPARPLSPPQRSVIQTGDPGLDDVVSLLEMQRGSAALAAQVEHVEQAQPAPAVEAAPEATSVSTPSAARQAPVEAPPSAQPPVDQAPAEPAALDAGADEDALPRHVSHFTRKADKLLATLEWPPEAKSKSAFDPPVAAVRRLAGRGPRLHVVKDIAPPDEDDGPEDGDPIDPIVFGDRSAHDVFAELIGRLEKWEASQLRVNGHLDACDPRLIQVRLQDTDPASAERLKDALEAQIQRSFDAPPRLDIETRPHGHPDCSAETVAEHQARLARERAAQREATARSHPAVKAAIAILGGEIERVVVP